MDKTETLSGYSIGIALWNRPISDGAEVYLRQALEKREGENQRRVIGVLGSDGLSKISRVLAEDNLWARLHPNNFYRELTDTTDPYALPVCEGEFLDAFRVNGDRFLAFAAQTGGFSGSREEIFTILNNLTAIERLRGYCMGSIISPISGYEGRKIGPGLRVVAPSLECVETLVRY